MNEKETVRISKFLSLVLRHKPQAVDIVLDENGWTDVSTLISRMNEKGFPLSMQTLQHVVETNSKKRFAFSDDQTKIRANQGHSVDVELGYEPKIPPVVLFHGTSDKSIPSILSTGLNKRQRHHVHLSVDVDTAMTVGRRYGQPVVLAVAAMNMYDDGYSFLVSANNVWLTDHVPVSYLSICEDKTKALP